MTIPVGVLGGTGLVGQRLLARLDDHPWFEVAAVAASDDRVGAPYGESVTWRIDEPLPSSVARLTLDAADPGSLSGLPPVVLSALPGSVAAEVEAAFAEAGTLVCSNASARRMAPDVPLIIPEINRDHLSLLSTQSRERGWSGSLVKNPNCMTATITIPLAALKPFEPRSATVVTLQAISGAGTGGVHGIDIVDNVLPDIPGEAEKLATEPTKLLADLDGETLDPYQLEVDAACHRVPVVDGHMATCFVELGTAPTSNEVRAALDGFDGVDLPLAPRQPITVIDEPRRPQPRYDRDTEDGMGVAVGPIHLEGSRLRFTCLAHNTVRGAAGACLLAAEAAVDAGYGP